MIERLKRMESLRGVPAKVEFVGRKNGVDEFYAQLEREIQQKGGARWRGELVGFSYHSGLSLPARMLD